MIVVCTGCSAKFKVADAKVGPKGAKLKCSRCQAVFTVHREEVVEPTPAPLPVAQAAPASPPPLPRRAATSTSLPAAVPLAPSPELGPAVDARLAFEVDLEPAAPRARPLPASPPPSPSSPLLGQDDPFAVPPLPVAAPGAALPPPPPDPFGVAAPDPFAAVQAPIPPDLLRAPTDLIGGEGDPFAAPLPAPPGAADDLMLEERSAPIERPRPRSSAPLGESFGGEDLDDGFGGGSPGDIPPLSNDLPGAAFGGFEPLPSHAPPEAASFDPEPGDDPFGGAPAGAAPSAGARPSVRPAAPEPTVGAGGTTDAARPPGPAPTVTAPVGGAEGGRQPQRQGRLRAAAVNVVSLAVLLLLALALLVFWRGGVPLSEAFHPSAVVAALTHHPHAGPFAAEQVVSGLYERRRGAPLLFVRGEVVSRAEGPVGAVRVSVSVVKNGRVLAGAAGLAGAVPTAEELYLSDDAGVGQLAEAVRARAPAQVRPGDRVPFLVVVPGLAEGAVGAALEVEARAEDHR